MLKFKLLNFWNKYWYLLFFVSAFIFSITFNIFFFDLSYGWDESIYLLHTDILQGRVSEYNEFGFRPILFSILLMPFFAVSDNLVFLRILMLTFAFLVCLILFFLINRMSGKEYAAVISGFFLISPLFLTTAQYLLTDIFVFLFALPAIYFSYRYYQTKLASHLIFASTFCALAFLTRFVYGAFLLVPVLLILTSYKNKKIIILIKELFYVLAPFILITTPYFIFSKLKFGSFFYTIKAGQFLVSWFDQPFYIYFLYLLKFWPIFFVAAAIGLYYLIRNRNYFYFSIFILFVVLFIYFSFTPHKEPRYTLALAISLIILAAYGFYCLFNKLSEKLLNKLKLLSFGIFFLFVIFYSLFLFYFLFNPVSIEHNNMKSIAFIQDMNFKGNIYTNTDVPQYIYLFKDRKIINVYWYALNGLDYKSLFKEPGIFVYNKNIPLDLNNLELVQIKDFSNYIVYKVK